jgi:hypothetical protein
VDVPCNYCGKSEHGHITCPSGHYICDHCHNQDTVRVIETIMLTTESSDPFAIVDLAMSLPHLPMLGCQHAYIAGGGLMAALKNKGVADLTPDDLKEVFIRTERQAHGGYCGLTGVCGVVPAIGACFAVLTGSKCGTDAEQRTTMEVVGKVTRAITELTGPSCCKAYVWSALAVAVAFLQEKFAITLFTENDPVCRAASKHPHGCREMKCPFFEAKKEKRSSSDG